MPVFPLPPSTVVLGTGGPSTASPVGGRCTSGYDLIVRQADREYSVVWVLADNGVPLVLPVGATVAFDMAVLGDADSIVGGGSTAIVDASNGKVSYTWQTADVALPGAYWAMFVVTFLDGSTRTYPNGRYLRILVTPSLG